MARSLRTNPSSIAKVSFLACLIARTAFARLEVMAEEVEALSRLQGVHHMGLLWMQQRAVKPDEANFTATEVTLTLAVQELRVVWS